MPGVSGPYKFNLWQFRNHSFNRDNVKVRDVSGNFGLPPLRGEDFLTYGKTGRLFQPKIHDSRDITLEIIVLNDAQGVAQSIFDEFSTLFANRAQGTLTNTLPDGSTRSGNAECTIWLPANSPDVVGKQYTGRVNFHLADPWLYGAVMTGSVTPASTITLGAPIVNQSAIARASFTLAFAGVVSGQPLIVVYYGYVTAISTVADNFATPYTWTKIDQSTTYMKTELWIGTGGVGTSGTVTVTPAANAICEGIGVALAGASTSAGLLAVDVHGNTAGATDPLTLSLTPSLGYEAAFYFASISPGTLYGPGAPWSATILNPYGYTQGILDTQLSPAPGTALTAAWGTGGGTAQAVAAIVKGGVVSAATLSINNTGTARAEKMTLDFLGPIVNPSLVNQNGVSVTFTGTVASTKHLIIDTGLFTALNDGANVIGSLTHSGASPFMALEPGANTLTVYGSGCSGATRFTCSFLPPYE